MNERIAGWGGAAVFGLALTGLVADQAPYMIRVEWDAPQGVTATYGML